MPAKYEAMRDKFLSEGKSESRSKSLAARIYNAQRKPGQAPVTRHEGSLERVMKKHRK